MEKRHPVGLNGHPTLFVGNFDFALSLAGVPVVGELSDMCWRIVPRCVHYLGPQDAALLYAQPEEEYLDYCQDLYGYRAKTFSPGEPVQNGALSLMDAVRADNGLLKEVERTRWETLDPFIVDPAVHWLAQRIGARTHPHLPPLAVSRLNDKIHFYGICRELGIPVPPESQVARGWESIVRVAGEILGRHGAVMIKQPCYAGGVGIHKVAREELECSLETHLEGMLLPHEWWENQPVLVEPALPLASSPLVFVRLRQGKWAGFVHSDQVMQGSKFTGGQTPSSTPRPILARMVGCAKNYARKLASRGYTDGVFSVDFGILTAEGQERFGVDLVAFESNARWGGVAHTVAIRQRLCSQPKEAHVISNDILPVSPGATLGNVLEHLKREGIAWDDAKEEGVVIAIPPYEKLGIMGFVALSKNPDKLREMGSVMARM